MKTAVLLGYPAELAILCDDVIVAAILRKVAEGSKGASRMYNMTGAANKVASFLSVARHLDAPSLHLTDCLMSHYNRLRY